MLPYHHCVSSFLLFVCFYNIPFSTIHHLLLLDWDYNLATEAVLCFNTTTEKGSIGRVAELAIHCPETFQHLRSVFDISEESYRQSIFGSGPFVSFQSNSKGAARVGGVFFFTRDGAYMVKTIKVRNMSYLFVCVLSTYACMRIKELYTNPCTPFLSRI
jgi:hypothetical protein